VRSGHALEELLHSTSTKAVSGNASKCFLRLLSLTAVFIKSAPFVVSVEVSFYEEWCEVQGVISRKLFLS